MTLTREHALFHETLTRSVIGAFFCMHYALGFGFREYIYALALQRELESKGHRVDREVGITVFFRGEPLAWQTLDMVVDEKLVLECKATEILHPGATLQLYGYLCATQLELRLLLHFGREPKFHRVIYENRFKRHQRGTSP